MGTQKRLSKALAAAGVTSRRRAELLIREGKVTVNGTAVFLPQTLVDWEKDSISVEGTPLKGEEEKLYFLLNKPRGWVCSNKPIGTKRLVIDLFRNVSSRLFTIGRLDRDTTGLLLVSNDGQFAQRVIHPSANLSKEYVVKTKEEIEHQHLVLLSKGARIEGQWVRPKRVEKLRKGTVKIVVREGKKREVRLFVQQAKLTLLSLHRTRIGGLRLGDLPEGVWRELSEKEQKRIFAK